MTNDEAFCKTQFLNKGKRGISPQLVKGKKAFLHLFKKRQVIGPRWPNQKEKENTSLFLPPALPRSLCLSLDFASGDLRRSPVISSLKPGSPFSLSSPVSLSLLSILFLSLPRYFSLLGIGTALMRSTTTVAQ